MKTSARVGRASSSETLHACALCMRLPSAELKKRASLAAPCCACCACTAAASVSMAESLLLLVLLLGSGPGAVLSVLLLLGTELDAALSRLLLEELSELLELR